MLRHRVQFLRFRDHSKDKSEKYSHLPCVTTHLVLQGTGCMSPYPVFFERVLGLLSLESKQLRVNTSANTALKRAYDNQSNEADQRISKRLRVKRALLFSLRSVSRRDLTLQQDEGMLCVASSSLHILLPHPQQKRLRENR